LNTRNFKGPVTFFTPYFWSHTAVTEPRFAGLLLDSRPSDPNRHLQMETQYVPASPPTAKIAQLGDGSVVTYYWYRFADQPALLNADLTPEEREAVQTRVEKLHRSWKLDRDYLPPPTVGKLAEIDPALVVAPPPGLEAGYVPIVTRQAAKE